MLPQVEEWLRDRMSGAADWPVEKLLAAKGATTVSVVLPARDERATVGEIVSTIRRDLVEDAPLVDEVLVIDSRSTDDTAAVAAAAGARVVAQDAVLPELLELIQAAGSDVNAFEEQLSSAYKNATTGDNALRVQACANCHGPGGVGEPPMYPYLAGLDAAYITSALNEWKNGSRRNDAGAQMATVASALSADDVAAVARYFAAMTAPKPAPQNIVQAPPPKPAAPAAPVTSGAPANPPPGKAVGVEQGQSTTGGTQGPGGSGASVNKSGSGKSQ